MEGWWSCYVRWEVVLLNYSHTRLLPAWGSPYHYWIALTSPILGISAIAIASGWYHTCVIMTGGGVKCWGGNDYGQLGIGSTGHKYDPTDVPGANSVYSALHHDTNLYPSSIYPESYQFSGIYLGCYTMTQTCMFYLPLINLPSVLSS